MPVDVQSYNPSLPPSQQQIAAQQRLAQVLSRQVARQPRFTHPQQALAPLGQNLAAALAGGRARSMENQRQQSLAQALAGKSIEGIDQETFDTYAQHNPEDALTAYLNAQGAAAERQRAAQAAAVQRQQQLQDAEAEHERSLALHDHKMANPGMTTSQRDFAAGQENPAYLEHLKELKKAGATSVSVGRGETEYDKALGKKNAERFIQFQDDANSARGALDSLEVMDQAMAQPGFYSGFGADQVATLKRAGAALGFNPDGISSMETFNAQAKSAALDAMGGSLGTGFSNADRDFVLDQVPGLSTTPEGNRMLIEVQRRMNRRKIEVADLARDYASRNGGRIDFGFDEELKEWRDENPMFADLSEAFKANGDSSRDNDILPMPKAGDVVEGYRFNGGDPNDQNNWQKVQP